MFCFISKSLLIQMIKVSKFWIIIQRNHFIILTSADAIYNLSVTNLQALYMILVAKFRVYQLVFYIVEQPLQPSPCHHQILWILSSTVTVIHHDQFNITVFQSLISNWQSILIYHVSHLEAFYSLSENSII